MISPDKFRGLRAEGGGVGWAPPTVLELFRAAVGDAHPTLNRGFSLLELLMVMLLIGIMAGVAGPSVGRFLDSLEFKKESAKVMATVRYARLKAITEGKLVVMTATEGEAAMGLTLSGAVNEVRSLDLADGASLEIEPLELLFSPEGYATPGTLILTSGERSETILIDPMTGLPLLEDVGDN